MHKETLGCCKQSVQSLNHQKLPAECRSTAGFRKRTLICLPKGGFPTAGTRLSGSYRTRNHLRSGSIFDLRNPSRSNLGWYSRFAGIFQLKRFLAETIRPSGSKQVRNAAVPQTTSLRRTHSHGPLSSQFVFYQVSACSRRALQIPCNSTCVHAHMHTSMHSGMHTNK